MRAQLWIIPLFLLALAGCGKEIGTPQDPPVTPPTPPGPPTTEAKVTLRVYGAFWCSTCSKELPELQTLIKDRLGERSSNVNIELYVPTGSSPSARPDEANAEAYRAKLDLKATAHIDEWRWKSFRATFQGAKMSLPAGVLLDEKGNTISTYPPGATTFVPDNIAADVAAAVGQNP